MLRRVKADVEHSLPPKKEYILYAPLTRPQVEIYEVCSYPVLNTNEDSFPLFQAILAGKVREWLIKNLDGGRGLGASGGNKLELNSDDLSEEEDDNEDVRKMRLRRRTDVSYEIIDNDEEYFSQVHDGEPSARRSTGRGRKMKEKTVEELGREYALKQASK